MDQSMQALLAEARAHSMTIAQLARAAQAEQDGVGEDALNQRMAEYLTTMRSSVDTGMDYSMRSLSGMTGGQAPLIRDLALSDRAAGGALLGMAAARAMAVAETNASMGRIVAAPTAGSCGILPAALLTVQETRGFDDARLIDGLFTAAAVGQIIARRASISGAEGGCQAECGSAAAMTAAALVEMMGGPPEAAAYACSFALMNSMGLVCDPVAGLVEIPCVYRNVAGVANALTAADMALAGLTCPIPADEVIDAMKAVGDRMPASLRETGEGGCAACPSARKMRAR